MKIKTEVCRFPFRLDFFTQTSITDLVQRLFYVQRLFCVYKRSPARTAPVGAFLRLQHMKHGITTTGKERYFYSKYPDTGRIFTNLVEWQADYETGYARAIAEVYLDTTLVSRAEAVVFARSCIGKPHEGMFADTAATKAVGKALPYSATARRMVQRICSTVNFSPHFLSAISLNKGKINSDSALPLHGKKLFCS